nr:hypothetical protein [Tanacetum cinerariifolium]
GAGDLGDADLGPRRLIFVPLVDRIGLRLLHRLDDVAVLDVGQAHEHRQHDDGDGDAAVEALVLGLGADFEFHGRRSAANAGREPVKS